MAVATSFYGASALWAYVLVVVIAFVVVRGAVRAVRGRRVSTGLLLGLPIILFALYALDILGTFYAGYYSTYATITVIGIIADGIALVAGLLIALRFAGRTLVFWQMPTTPGGRWYYRIGPAIPIAYVVFFLARVAIESLVAGIVPFTVPDTLNGLSPAAVYSLTVVDAMWGLTTGLYLGRNWVVLKRWHRREDEATGRYPLRSVSYDPREGG